MQRRGSNFYRTELARMLEQFNEGDLVCPTFFVNPAVGLKGVVTRVNPKENKVYVAWNGGSTKQHDPDEIMLAVTPVDIRQTGKMEKMEEVVDENPVPEDKKKASVKLAYDINFGLDELKKLLETAETEKKENTSGEKIAQSLQDIKNKLKLIESKKINLYGKIPSYILSRFKQARKLLNEALAWERKYHGEVDPFLAVQLINTLIELYNNFKEYDKEVVEKLNPNLESSGEFCDWLRKQNARNLYDFFIALGWPEGYSYCTGSKKYCVNTGYPAVKKDVTKIKEASELKSRRQADLKLSPKDKKVIEAFVDKKPLDSQKLYTDGKKLDGLWFGGKEIAEWNGDKIELGYVGGRSGQTVQHYLKKIAKFWIKNASKKADFIGEPNEIVPPEKEAEFMGDKETHGIDGPRGGGFDIMQKLVKDLREEQLGELKTSKSEYIVKKFIGRRMARRLNKIEQEEVLKSNDARKIYEFARDVKGADINKLEDAIIKSGDKYYISYFAEDIKGADIKKLEEAIIKTGDAEKIYYFARDIEGADIDKLQEAIIKTNNTKWIEMFNKKIKEN